MAAPTSLSLRPVDKTNWRIVSALKVNDEQRAFVEEPTYYLALCCYSLWNPLAIYVDDVVIGFMMWAVADDKRYWLGGIFIDNKYQGKGYGKTAIQKAIKLLREKGASEFALSYHPDNAVAKRLYARLGFVETGEVEDDEVVARLLPQ